jgi:fumarate hydratase class II
MPRYRTERDVLGSVKVPSESYYGSETARALDNFRISGEKMDLEFIRAYALLKKCAVRANIAIGKMDKEKGSFIVKACDMIIGGALSDQFVVDVFQAGAGTSVNMNLNEVIANKALEIAGRRKGDYRYIHPNDHVNMSQSTNDTFPTVIDISAYSAVNKSLLPALKGLENALMLKSREFTRIVKLGRTHLQDAVPITLGEEFSGYAWSVRRSREEVERRSRLLLEIPIGGTAVGTGINAGRAYKSKVISELRKETGYGFAAARNVFSSMQGRIEVVAVSNAINEAAISIGKIANDLRLLGSGPRGGIGEIFLPEVQPGSSIMPGKINPSMAEMMNMACFEVSGRNLSIINAAASGQLELNVFMPVMAHDFLVEIRVLSGAVRAFTDKCILGIRPNRARISELVERNISIATSLTPKIGYAAAAEIAREAYKKGMSVREVCRAKGILSVEELDELLDPARLV